MPMLLALLQGCLIDALDRENATDRDGDGYASDQVDGGDDCNDDDPTIHPGAFESCLDEVDSDCDDSLCPPQTLVDMGAIDPLFWGEPGEALTARQAIADFNGDDVLDLALSAPAAADGAGRVYLIPGPLSETSSIDDASLVIDGVAGDHLQVSGTGDLDGNGIDELYLSALHVEGSQVFVVDETATASDPFALTIQTAPLNLKKKTDEEELDEFLLIGGALPVGDDTLLVMAPLDGLYGAAYLIDPPTGDVDLTSETPRATLLGDNPYDFFGGSSHTTPDFDGDGVDDIMVASPGFDLLDKDGDLLFYEIGGVYGFNHNTEGTLYAHEADLVIYGSFAESHIEWVSDLGDLNNDGYDDVGVFAHTGPGDLAVFYGPLQEPGTPALKLTSDADFKLFGDGTETDTEDFGFETIGLDANEDGVGDILIPAPSEGIFLSDVPSGGANYLFLGPISGVLGPDHADACWRGGLEEGQLGHPAVADLDQDGTLDLLMAAPGASQKNEDHRGGVYVLFDGFGGL